MSAEQQAADGDVVKKFLNDPVVKATIGRLSKKYYDEFVATKTPEAREGAWAKARALEDLAIELLAVVDTGTRAKVDLERKAQLENRQRPTRR